MECVVRSCGDEAAVVAGLAITFVISPNYAKAHA